MLRRKPSASVDNDETVALDYKNTVEPSLRFGRHDCQTVRIAFQVVDAWNLVGQSCHPNCCVWPHVSGMGEWFSGKIIPSKTLICDALRRGN